MDQAQPSTSTSTSTDQQQHQQHQHQHQQHQHQHQHHQHHHHHHHHHQPSQSTARFTPTADPFTTRIINETSTNWNLNRLNRQTNHLTRTIEDPSQNQDNQPPPSSIQPPTVIPIHLRNHPSSSAIQYIHHHPHQQHQQNQQQQQQHYHQLNRFGLIELPPSFEDCAIDDLIELIGSQYARQTKSSTSSSPKLILHLLVQ